MAKARMTIKDTRDGGTKFTFEYDPPLEQGQQILTGAQAAMYEIQRALTAGQVSDATDQWLGKEIDHDE